MYVNLVCIFSRHIAKDISADPPVPGALTRVTPSGGEFVEGYWMPENVSKIEKQLHRVEQSLTSHLDWSLCASITRLQLISQLQKPSGIRTGALVR